MARCTQAFDIGIQPSIDCDTSSFSMKEQMAAEKPVIASDYGGLVEIITDGAEGLVAPTGTVEPLDDLLIFSSTFVGQPDVSPSRQTARRVELHHRSHDDRVCA